MPYSKEGWFSCRFSSLLACLLSISFLTLITCIALLHSTPSGKISSTPLLISLACNASSFPHACQSSLALSPLAALGRANTPASLIAFSVALAHQQLQLCHAFCQALQSQDPNLANTARTCEYLLRWASHTVEKCSMLCGAATHTTEDVDTGQTIDIPEDVSTVGNSVPGLVNLKKTEPAFTKIKDMEAWMSAALTWENDCLSALGYVNATHTPAPGVPPHHGSNADKHSWHDGMHTTYSVHSDVPHHGIHVNKDPLHHRMYATYLLDRTTRDQSYAADLVDNLMQHVHVAITLTSNALSMLDAYDTYGPNVSAWSPPSKRNLPGFQDLQDGDERMWHTYDINGLHPTVTVSKDGHGDYSSIQEAVDDAPENASERYVIYIKQGIYNETVRVPYTKSLVAFVGEGMGKTIITGNMNGQMSGVSTYDTATVAVDGDGFLAYNLTFENTAHPGLHQAVALRVGSDRSSFYNCSFIGHQDTLYAHSLRQFYQNCRIEGTIDFIFGNAASIFRNCEVLIRPGRTSSSVVTAQGRRDPAETTGFVFEGCTVNGTEEFMERFVLNPKKYKVYLGRPWKMYSRTIYKNTVMERLIRPEGWRPWRGAFALDTLFYGEYNNSGIGANASGRVGWSEQISSSLAKVYSVSNFIQGDEWLGSTANDILER